MERVKRHLIVPITALLIALACIGAFLLTRSHPKDIVRNADRLVALCAQEGDREKCYEREVPKLYGPMKLPEVFDVLRVIRSKDPSYQFCHLLAHKLGEDSVLKDPSKWLDQIPNNPPDSLCSNGFIHGVVIGRFRDDVLTPAQMEAAMPDFKIACEPHGDWHPSQLDQAMCYHALGHLFDYIDNADMKRSLAACDEVAGNPGTYLRVCQEGVFMQMYQPVEPDDYELITHLGYKLTKDSYRTFCARFSDPNARGACLREAWPLVREDVVSGKGVRAYCSGQPQGLEEACYQTAAAIVGRMSLNDESQASTACNYFPSEWRMLCYETAAQAFLEEDRTDATRAIQMCQRADNSTARACLEELASRTNFIFGPDENMKRGFCAQLERKTEVRCAQMGR